MVALRLSVVSRGQAIGVLVTKGIPLPDYSGQGEGQSYLASSWVSRAVAVAPSFQTCFAYTFCMRVCIYVYVCMCADLIYVYICMCVCICTSMR